MTDERRKDEPGPHGEAERGTPRRARKNPPGTDGRDTDARMPPAGPHDKPGLTEPDATPGTGALPGHERKDDDADPAGG